MPVSGGNRQRRENRYLYSMQDIRERRIQIKIPLRWNSLCIISIQVERVSLDSVRREQALGDE